MKLLLIADLHLDTHFNWAGPQAARTRRQALREALLRTVRAAQEEGVDALLCGGDLYEQERFSPDTAEFLRSSFERLHPLPIYIAPGNHDWYGPSSLYRQVAWPPNVHLFTESRLEPRELADGLTLWGAAHRAPANTEGFLERFSVDRGGVNLALFHGSELHCLAFQSEGKIPHAPFRAEQIAGAGLNHAFLGHFHAPKDAELFTYPGNPEPLSFGEEGERGVVIATVHPDGSLTRERRRVATTESHDVELDLTGCASQQEVRERLASVLAGRRGFARVTLVGELAPAVDLRAEDLARLRTEELGSDDGRLEALVVRAGDLRAGYGLDAIGAEPTVRGRFVRDVLAAGLEEQEKRRVLMTGLRALDGRGDLEVL